MMQKVVDELVLTFINELKLRTGLKEVIDRIDPLVKIEMMNTLKRRANEVLKRNGLVVGSRETKDEAEKSAAEKSA